MVGVFALIMLQYLTKMYIAILFIVLMYVIGLALPDVEPDSRYDLDAEQQNDLC